VQGSGRLVEALELNPPDQEGALNRRTGLIFRNVAANYAGTVSILLMAFFLTPFLVNRLGNLQFGLWAIIGGVMAYGGLLDLGVSTAVVKYVGEHSDLDDVPGVEKVIHNSLAVYLAIGAAVLVFTGAATLVVPLVFPIPEELVGTSMILVAITGGSLAVNFPLGMYNGVLLGLQRHHVVNAADILWGVGTTAGAVIVVGGGGGLIGLALVYLVGNTLGQMIRIGYLLIKHPEVRWLRVRFDRVTSGKIFSFSIWAFLLRLASTLRSRTDEIVVGASLSVAAVTPYFVGLRLGDSLSRLTSQVSAALFPYGSRLDALEDREGLRHMYLTATRSNLAIAMPMALFLWIQAPRFIEAWMGPGFEQSTLPARLLILAVMCHVYVAVGHTFLKSINRHQAMASWSMVEVLANLALSLILVRFYGLAGVAAGTLIPALAYNLGFVLPHASSRLGARVLTVVRQSVVPQVPALTVSAVVMLVAANLPGDPGLFRLIGEAAAAGLTYWAVYYFLGAGPEERALARRVVGGLMPDRKAPPTQDDRAQ